MRPFDFYSPASLYEALSLMEDLGENALPLAGGTDLIPRLKSGDLTPPAVVSLKRIKDLEGISFDVHQGLRLGSRVTLGDLVIAPLIREHYPILAETAGVMASRQIRNLATVGGNLANAAPSADLAPPLLVLGAEVRLVSVAGERQIPLQEFFLGPGRTSRQPSELLLEIRLPPPEGTALYTKYTPRAYMDLAVVGVAVRVSPPNGHRARVRIALGAVSPVPILALRAAQMVEGGSMSAALVQRAGETAAEECSPIDDVRASAAYRRRMVTVLVCRGLERLAARAGKAGRNA